MPARHIVDKERRLVIILLSDPLTLAEIEVNQEEIRGDPDFDPSFNYLADATQLTNSGLSVEEAKAIAGRVIFRPPSRGAVVARDPAVFGMGRLFSARHTMATGEELRLFYDRDEALRWLGLDPFPFP